MTKSGLPSVSKLKRPSSHVDAVAVVQGTPLHAPAVDTGPAQAAQVFHLCGIPIHEDTAVPARHFRDRYHNVALASASQDGDAPDQGKARAAVKVHELGGATRPRSERPLEPAQFLGDGQRRWVTVRGLLGQALQAK